MCFLTCLWLRTLNSSMCLLTCGLPARGNRSRVTRMRNFGSDTTFSWLLRIICSWRKLMLGTILIVILILLLIGALPSWPYSSGWGYYPSGGLGLIVVILLILLLMVAFDEPSSRDPMLLASHQVNTGPT